MGILPGKGAVVTGGSRSIGRAVVERLTADGAHVVFTSGATEAAAAVADAVRGVAGAPNRSRSTSPG